MEGTKFIYKDWTYELKNSNFNVIPPEGIETPSSVFKYYSNNKNSLDALVNQYLFCSHPYQLNDSIDSTSLLWDFSNLSKGIFEKFYYQYGLNQIDNILEQVRDLNKKIIKFPSSIFSLERILIILSS